MNIFITGASGFLGGEVLVELSKRENIDKIFCLVRAKSQEEANLRIQKVFKLHNDFFDEKKIIPVIGNLLDDDFTEQLINNKELAEVNYIVHSAANTSFSRIYDDLVEKVNIGGLTSILKWSKTLKHLDTFVYVGTATICGCGVTDKVIYENDSPSADSKHFVKYTQTKMRGEILLHDFLPEDKILIVRPSIIMGDSRTWKPRSYVILWALATINLMRLIPVNENANLDVISVDYAAKSIVALIYAKRKYRVYHISSGVNSASNVLKVTNAIEGAFNNKPPFKFIAKPLINQMKCWAKGRLQEDSELFNYPEYLSYWESIFENRGKLRILFAGFEPYVEFIQLGQVFDNSRLLEDTDIGVCKPVHEYVLNSIPYLDEIDVYDGALDP